MARACSTRRGGGGCRRGAPAAAAVTIATRVRVGLPLAATLVRVVPAIAAIATTTNTTSAAATECTLCFPLPLPPAPLWRAAAPLASLPLCHQHLPQTLPPVVGVLPKEAHRVSPVAQRGPHVGIGSRQGDMGSGSAGGEGGGQPPARRGAGRRRRGKGGVRSAGKGGSG